MQSEIKKKLLDHCYSYVQLKQKRLQTTISDAQNSLESESQSTAGDKHDTSRAMMHLEIEKKSTQLIEIEKLKRVLNQIDYNKSLKTIGLGSIIETDSTIFFIAINGGKHVIEETEYTIISLASPIAQSFKTASINDIIKVMDRNYRIEKMY